MNTDDLLRLSQRDLLYRILEELENVKPAPNTGPHQKHMSNTNDEQIRADKQLRVSLDGSLQILKVLESSRERSLAITKVQEAIMWLGMDLKRLGTPTPYPQSYNPESPIVEPTADNLKL